ncbi:MAG: hypothetical protein ABR538_13105, partial [Candidatus Binatia bacterium]
MTTRRISQVLWLALVFSVPLPFFLVEVGREPVAGVAALLGLTLAWIVVEGSHGALAWSAALLASQVFLGMALLAAASVVATRLTHRVTGRYTALVVGLLVVALFTVALARPIYRTPFRGGGLHATLV